MSQESQENPGGNTKNPRTNQLYNWVFTLSRAKCESASQLSQLLKIFCKKFTFQGEEGKEGYRHWQGAISLEKKEYFSTVVNMMPGSCHIEPMKCYFSAFNYAQKIDTRTEGPYTEKSVFLKIISKLHPWQDHLIKLIDKENTDRKIFWIWDAEGNSGKTALCKYLYMHRQAELFNNCKTADIAFAISNNPIFCVFNISRSSIDHINYGVIESLKDGLLFSGKYESRCKIFNPPIVLIFANFEPDYSKFSADRWRVLKVNEIPFSP